MEKRTTLYTTEDDRKLAAKIAKRIEKQMLAKVSFSAVVRQSLRSLAKELGI